ncbi:unnamed protein product [Zymoseptoria tritici ST99CH_3D7]|uniref:NACHT-NTPase and P-loop NTPases N-terminal domain-containing protein n=1 Tax=Zymoseptoria tritici (strain ST99CH_3D7) TaxID=1276538 RepID=A0A1X7RU60_ZYMT9|nr:unnamed protein product [Zymoseptoria tritici ST99CH_3D7]
MEPLSAVASSISVLQLSASSVKHLRDVCDSEGPKVRLLLEISTTKGILETLKDLSTNASKSDPVLENIETLQEPMKRYEALLKKLEAKLSSSHGLKKVAKALKWPTEKSEIAESLVQLESYQKRSRVCTRIKPKHARRLESTSARPHHHHSCVPLAHPPHDNTFDLAPLFNIAQCHQHHAVQVAHAVLDALNRAAHQHHPSDTHIHFVTTT